MTAAERIGARAVARVLARLAAATGGRVGAGNVEVERPGRGLRAWPAGVLR